jgi:type I restriction enzyme S subunit
LRFDNFAQVALPNVPIAEQRSIAEFLETQTIRIDKLVSRIRSAVEHLHELRTALISAAVTGKIDVRYPSDPATNAGATA